MSINLEFYSDKCIVIRDNYNMHSSEIIRLGGKFNDKLRGGPGWIFSRNMEKKLLDAFGDMLSTNPTPTPNATPEFKPTTTSEVDDTLKYINDIESMLLDAHKKISIIKKMMINKKGNKSTTVVDEDTDEQEEFTTKKRLIK